MKKILLFSISFFPLWGLGGLCLPSFAQSSVTITPITANYAASPPTVTFEVSWAAGSRNEVTNRSKVWLYVDYRRVKDHAYVGDWLRAGIPTNPPATASAGTVYYETGNTKGFWLQGSATGAFAATVTVPLTVDLTGGYAPIFGWCAYATDRPPTAVAKQGGYTLHGTPPFIIQTDPTNTSSTVPEPSHNYTECNIYKITDATGCPGDNPPPIPSITGFEASAASICAGQSVTLTANATDAELYSFDDGLTWLNSASTVVSPSTTTTYTLKITRTAGGCTVTYPETRTITVHPLPAPAFVNPPAGLCLNTEATLTVNDPTGAASSYCFTYECAGCVKNAYLTGNEEPAAAGCYWFSECQYGTANTYSVSMYDAGTITVRAEAISEYGCVNSTSAVIRGSYVAPLAPPVISGATINECPSETVVLTATASGATTFTWYKDGTQVQTGTSSDYAATATGTYTVAGTNEYCSGPESAAQTVTISVCNDVPGCVGLKVFQTTNASDGASSWDPAIAACAAQGARIPTHSELLCMCANQSLMTVPFNNTYYWGTDHFRTAVHMGDCAVRTGFDHYNTLYYRCVL